MLDLWEEFKPLPEAPGVSISKEEAVGKSGESAQFLYVFRGPKKNLFKVFEGAKGIFVTDIQRRNILVIEIRIISNIL